MSGKRPRPRPQAAPSSARLRLGSKVPPAELAAANAALDAWQASLWQRPVDERHQAIDRLLEGLHA